MPNDTNYASAIKTKIDNLISDSKTRANMLSSLKLIASGRGINGITYTVNWDIENEVLMLYVCKSFHPDYNKPIEAYAIQVKDSGLPILLDSCYEAISSDTPNKILIANCDTGTGPWSEIYVINSGGVIQLEFNSSLMESIRFPMMLYNDKLTMSNIHIDRDFILSSARDYVRVLESVIAEYLIIIA